MPGPEIQANAINTRSARTSRSARARLARHAPDRRCSRLLTPLASLRLRIVAGARSSASRSRRFTRRRPARVQRRHDPAVRLPGARAGRSASSATLAVAYASTCAFERQPARDVSRASCPRRSSTRCSRSADDDLRLGGVAARVHGHVQRPARLHVVRRAASAERGHRGAQPLPDRDERRDPRPRRHARRLHGRRDHGRLRRAARTRTTTPTARSPRRARCSTRGCRASTRGCTEQGMHERLPHGHRPQQRPGDVRQRRLRARALEYTAVGDTTNTAARLEGMTKGTPHPLLVGRRDARCSARPPGLVEVGELEVRGRTATSSCGRCARPRAPTGAAGDAPTSAAVETSPESVARGSRLVRVGLAAANRFLARPRKGDPLTRQSDSWRCRRRWSPRSRCLPPRRR